MIFYFFTKNTIFHIKALIKKKAQEAYLSHIRRRAITKLLAFNRMIGSNPFERARMDSQFLLRIYAQRKTNDLVEKSECIVKDFLRRAGKVYHFSDRLNKILMESLFLLNDLCLF